MRRLIYAALALTLAPSSARARRFRTSAVALTIVPSLPIPPGISRQEPCCSFCYGHYVSGMKVLLTPKDGGDFMLTVAVRRPCL